MPHETSMSAASRKAWNLKVIQRHDPDILCIWDQVSYVMLMQYSSTGWIKTSVEGSLFLFDRRGLPRYGFFILNRSSSQNYMHLLTAEDNLEVQDSYVIFRAKGSRDAPVLGLWAGDPDHRQHLGETLLGLHSHIKSGSSAPYYDTAAVHGATPSQSSDLVQGSTPTTSYPSGSVNLSNDTPNKGSSSGAPAGMQSLTDLFARLSSSASTHVATPPPVSDTSHSPFYATPAPELPTSKASMSSVASAPSASSSTGPLRGQALLDSLFAMASPPPIPAAPQPSLSAKPAVSNQGTPQPPRGSENFGAPPPSSQQPRTASQSSAPTGGDLLMQLFGSINGPQPSTNPPPAPPANQSRTINHTRTPSTPPPIASLPADPAIIHSTKVTPEPKHDRRRNTRRGYATDTSPRPQHTPNRISVFDEDAVHSRSNSQTGGEVLAALNGSVRSKPRIGRALVPFQSDTGPEYHPDPTRPHVSSRFPAGLNGEEAKVYSMPAGDEDGEDEIFYDGRGNGNENGNGGKGQSPKRQKRRQRNGRGGGANGNGSGGRNGDAVNLDRQIAGEALMQGIEWDEGVVDKQLFLQSIYALLNEQEFVDQLYNDYKIAQTRQT